MRPDAWDVRIADVLDRVARPRVLRQARAVVVDLERVGVELDVLEHRAVADRAEDLGLLVRAQVDALGVAAALDVEDPAVAPAVLRQKIRGESAWGGGRGGEGGSQGRMIRQVGSG